MRFSLWTPTTVLSVHFAPADLEQQRPSQSSRIVHEAPVGDTYPEVPAPLPQQPRRSSRSTLGVFWSILTTVPCMAGGCRGPAGRVVGAPGRVGRAQGKSAETSPASTAEVLHKM